MTQDDFAREFKTSFRKLWIVAAAVLHGREWADDAVQEAAVVALDKLDQFQEGTSFVAWMSQIVRFVALNFGRRKRSHRTESVEPERLDSERGPERGERAKLTKSGQLPAHQEHFDDRVAGELARLAPVARACLLLRTLENLEYDDIAGMLDIPAGTAMSHVHRSRQQLRLALTGLEGEVRT